MEKLKEYKTTLKSKEPENFKKMMETIKKFPTKKSFGKDKPEYIWTKTNP